MPCRNSKRRISYRSLNPIIMASRRPWINPKPNHNPSHPSPNFPKNPDLARKSHHPSRPNRRNLHHNHLKSINWMRRSPKSSPPRSTTKKYRNRSQGAGCNRPTKTRRKKTISTLILGRMISISIRNPRSPNPSLSRKNRPKNQRRRRMIWILILGILISMSRRNYRVILSLNHF